MLKSVPDGSEGVIETARKADNTATTGKRYAAKNEMPYFWRNQDRIPVSDPLSLLSTRLLLDPDTFPSKNRSRTAVDPNMVVE